MKFLTFSIFNRLTKQEIIFRRINHNYLFSHVMFKKVYYLSIDFILLIFEFKF